MFLNSVECIRKKEWYQKIWEIWKHIHFILVLCNDCCSIELFLLNDMTEIMFTSNTLEFDTRKIWDSANSHQHYIVFLEDEISFVLVLRYDWEKKILYLKIVAFSRYVGTHFLAVAESYNHTLSVGWIRLLGFPDDSFQDHPFQHGTPAEGILGWPDFFVWPFQMHFKEKVAHRPFTCNKGIS